MADAQQINDFLVDAFGRINKIEERAMTTGLGSAISITEIHIIEKIGLSEPARMSEIAHMLGVTLATMTVACDKLEGKGLVRRARSRSDRRVVQVTLTPRGRAVYEYHRAFHERMISSILDTLSPEQSTVLAQSLEKLRFSPSCTLKRLYYWALSRFIREAYTNVTPFRYIASRTSNAVSRSCSIA